MLTERQKRILWAVIDDYIVSAEPVGSRTVSKKEGVGVSSATIRNEMADLEDMGFLEQPHTSAGRIPSQKGYRFYVDHLPLSHLWSKEDIQAIQDYATLQLDDVEQTFQYISVMLAHLTNCMTFVVGCNHLEEQVKCFQFIPLSECSAVSILVTNTGRVHQHRVTLPEDISLTAVERLVNLLNARLIGVPLTKIRQMVTQELADECARYVTQVEDMADLLDQMLQAERGDRLYTSGTARILDQPEFRDVEKIKPLFDLIEEDQILMGLLEPKSAGVHVRIGCEHHVKAVQHCSIVTSAYTRDGESVGAIGVLGPMRMDYRRVMSLIDFMASDFSNRLRIWEK
jgi:heat-inducible transcriptional repressor